MIVLFKYHDLFPQLADNTVLYWSQPALCKI